MRGTLTHKRTSSNSAGIRLTVTGKMTVAKGGAVTADEKSKLRPSCSGGSCYSTSYGGTGKPTRYTYSNAPYGSVADPDDLGAYAPNWFGATEYAGGLVLMAVGRMAKTALPRL